MLDEAHERTINTDVLFGLTKGALKNRLDVLFDGCSHSQQAGPETHSDIGDAERGKVLDILQRLPHLPHSGHDVSGRGP